MVRGLSLVAPFYIMVLVDHSGDGVWDTDVGDGLGRSWNGCSSILYPDYHDSILSVVGHAKRDAKGDPPTTELSDHFIRPQTCL